MSDIDFNNKIRIFSSILYDENVFNLGDPITMIEHDM